MDRHCARLWGDVKMNEAGPYFQGACNSVAKINIHRANNITDNNTSLGNEEDSDPLAGIIALGLSGGGSYWGYKKYKKS